MVAEMPETRFTRVDDLDIAYQVVGPAAGLDLVFVPGWVSHLEVMWELPEFARFLDRLAAMGRLIMFDKRGTGLSDRVTGVPTLEQRADDIVAVMDAAGSARAAIAAWGEGAGIAAMFAATYPERVAALVLGSVPVKVTDGSASGASGPSGHAGDVRGGRAWLGAGHPGADAGAVPGRGHPVPVLVPAVGAAVVDPERGGCDAALGDGDATWGRFCPSIQARTLLVHRRDAALFDPESVRAAAKLIPDARCAWLPGADALPYVGDTDAVMDVIQEFLTGAQADGRTSTGAWPRCCSPTSSGRPRRPTSSATAAGGTCSTSITPAFAGCWTGSAAWRSTPRETASSPPSTAPPGPSGARARSRDAVREIGVEIRAGLHTGEVERRGTAATGLAVHVGARVAALAQASEVLVTSTVKMLVLGSGIGFADRGRHRLKGVPDQWQLFAVEHT